MITVKRKVSLRPAGHADKPAVASIPPASTERVPRVARLMALAIQFDRALRAGKVGNLSELARLVHVTQPRMTQIMNLNLLAPEIQEQVLGLTMPSQGRTAICERRLRPLCAVHCWRQQLHMWQDDVANGSD